MRIQGVDLPRDKRIEVALQYLYGVGPTRSKEILAKAGVSPDVRTKDLTEAETTALRSVGEYHIEADLRREVQMNIKRLIEIGCYRGLRHRQPPAHPRAAHEDQFAHPQGSQEDRGRRARRRGMKKK
jgi:small subunit ribosomal protein S13